MLPPLLVAKSDADLGLLPAMANRHGLITGATGTGKTITLQSLAEKFSSIGIPVFVADVKGDLAGMAAAGGGNRKVEERVKSLEDNYRKRRSQADRTYNQDTREIQKQLQAVQDRERKITERQERFDRSKKENQRLRAALIDQLSPTLLLIDPARADALWAELVAKGYTPRRARGL